MHEHMHKHHEGDKYSEISCEMRTKACKHLRLHKNYKHYKHNQKLSVLQ